MSQEELLVMLDELRGLPAETEWVEFKTAAHNIHLNDIGEYFSALCNEANLKQKAFSWLIFGVNDNHKVVGTHYRERRADLDSLKSEIAQHTTNNITFTEIYEVRLPEGRVILLQIPSAPVGIPVAWKGHYYGRDGECLCALNIQEIE